jgi:hypothetical protein
MMLFQGIFYQELESVEFEFIEARRAEISVENVRLANHESRRDDIIDEFYTSPTGFGNPGNLTNLPIYQPYGLKKNISTYFKATAIFESAVP